MTTIRYIFRAILTLPLLPIMLLEGWHIKRQMPQLPEANDTEGMADAHTDRSLRLLAIGESTIAGVGAPSHAEGLTGTLADILAKRLNTNIHWNVHAKSGSTARQVTERLLPKIAAETADLIVIGLGANDAFTLNPPHRWRRHLRGLIAQLRNRFGQTPIVFINMPPVNAFPALSPLLRFTIGNHVALLAEELTQFAQNEPNVYFDTRSMKPERWLSERNLDTADFFSDGVHPSALAYQLWAEEIAVFIEENYR